MSFLRPLRRPPALHAWLPARRCYASASNPAQASSSQDVAPAEKKSEAVLSKSSCPEGTILTGLNYLKGQGEVVAQADDAYPDWLWKLVGPRQLPNDGPGGKTEKVALRKENRQRIREQNFLKTQ